MTDKRALIVDDEPDIRELLEITLGRMGLETESAADIAEAHTLLEQHEFDVCLTDMRLPDGDGLDLVESVGAAGEDFEEEVDFGGAVERNGLAHSISRIRLFSSR